MSATSRPSTIARAELRLVHLPTRELLAAGHDRAPGTGRELVIIRVENTEGVVGWGECSALNRPTYTNEWARGAFDLLASLDLGTFTDSARLRTTAPMAAAGIEMAATDVDLKSRQQSLARMLGVSRRWVPAGVAVGLAPLDELLGRVDDLVEAGFGRIKLKIEPGRDIVEVRAIRSRHPELEVHVDANGSYPPEGLETMLTLTELGIDVIEQPFHPDDLTSVRHLVDAGVSVVGDESVATLDDARRLHHLGALTAISLKPARVGGLVPARAIHDWAARNGIDLTAGGMLECGLGRHALAAFAGLEGFTLTGDLSPARRWLAADPWPDLELVRHGAGVIAVPRGPGIAPDPDVDLLERYTVARAELRR